MLKRTPFRTFFGKPLIGWIRNKSILISRKEISNRITVDIATKMQKEILVYICLKHVVFNLLMPSEFSVFWIIS